MIGENNPRSMLYHIMKQKQSHLSKAFIAAKVYLFAFASIFVPSIKTFLNLISPSSWSFMTS